MKNAFLYCDKRSLNDATNYYVDIIKRCLIKKGYTYNVVYEISAIKKADLIITITSRYFFIAKLYHPKVKTIFWAQGVAAEEAKMTSRGLKGFCRVTCRRFTEYFAVNKSTVLLCVSQKMIDYFKDCYRYNNNNNVVMPCYNLPMSSTFNIEQYKKPTFVYAGGASIWQGVDFMLQVFSIVEKKITDAKIIICSNEKDVFLNKMRKYNINNYEIKYVPVSKLQEELHNYKYGFIIRERNIVNQVATPTKMNSYLAALLIPIFSDGVDDFNKNIKLNEFTLKVSTPLDINNVASQIINFERSIKDYSKYKNIVEDVFNNHYNDLVYIERIDKILNIVGI